MKSQRARDRGLQAMDAVIVLIAILLIVQMWVLTASLESDLAGHTAVVVPAALVSGAILFGCWLLYLFLLRVDREASEGD